MGRISVREVFRTVLAVSCVATLGVLAVGCSQPASSTPQETALPVMSLWHSDFRADAIEGTVGGIGAETVTLTARKLDPTIFETKAVDSIAADEAPAVWLIPNDWVPDHLNKIVTIPNDFWVSEDATGPQTTLENFKENYYDYLVDDLTLVNYEVVPDIDVEQAASTEIRFAGFPGPIKTLVVFKNQSLFANAYQTWRNSHREAPDEEQNHIRQILTKEIKTWDELVEASNLLKSIDGTNVKTAGIAMGTANNIDQADDIVQLLTFQQGGRIVNAVEKIALFDGFEKTADGRTIYPGREALSFYTSFSNPNNSNYSWNNGMPNARQAFLEGRVAMLIDYPEFDEIIKQQEKRVSFEIAKIPQLYEETEPVNFATYYVFTVTKASQDQVKAGFFARNFTEDVNLRGVARGLVNSTAPRKNMVGGGVNDQQVPTARTVYKLHHDKFDATYKEMIDDVAIGGESVENAVNRTADLITRLLQSE